MTTRTSQGYVVRPWTASTRLTRWATHRWRVIGVAVAMGVPLATSAQSIGPDTFRDSLVMRQLAFRAPCPKPVPVAWTLVDSSLGRPPRCSLVEVAVRAVSQYLQTRPQANVGDPRNPLCVRVTVSQNHGTPGVPADWWVLFDLTADTPAWVAIDRHNGDIALTIVGHGVLRDWPRCLTR